MVVHGLTQLRGGGEFERVQFAAGNRCSLGFRRPEGAAAVEVLERETHRSVSLWQPAHTGFCWGPAIGPVPYDGSGSMCPGRP